MCGYFYVTAGALRRRGPLFVDSPLPTGGPFSVPHSPPGIEYTIYHHTIKETMQMKRTSVKKFSHGKPLEKRRLIGKAARRGKPKSLKTKSMDQWAQEVMVDATIGEYEAAIYFTHYFVYFIEYVQSISDDFSAAAIEFSHPSAVHDVYAELPPEVRQAFEEYAARKQEKEGGPQKEKA